MEGQPVAGEEPGDLLELEQLAEERRRESDKMMWQVPGLSIAAQAFLYSRAFDPDTGPAAQGAVALVALVIALATIHLLLKHSFFEETYSWALDAFRVRRGAVPLNGARVFEDAAVEHATDLRQRGDERQQKGAGQYLRWVAAPRQTLVVRQPARRVWVRSLWLFAAVDCGVLVVAVLRHCT